MKERGTRSDERRGAAVPSRAPSAAGSRLSVGSPSTARAWLEVDLEALRRNAAALRDRLDPATRLLPMVKADAYGLGAARVARALADRGVWGFGVATVDEGADLRRAGIRERVVVFTPCAPLDAPRLVQWGLEPVVTSLGALSEYAGAVGGAEAPLPVHLEVDTGMGRFGLPAEEAGAWAERVRELLAATGLELASTFTHFHSAEGDRAATGSQWSAFRAAVESLRRAGVDPGLLHSANSAAVLRHPDAHADLVRPGLFLFGGEAWPADAADLPRPEPVAHVRARVLEVRELPAGATVSYGATYRTSRPCRLATLGIGYADGLPHALSNRGEALVRGRHVPVVGAVCMDMTVVDVTEVEDVRPGTKATLLGREGEAGIGLGEVAALSGRIPYEVLTGFSARLPRVTARSAEGGGEGRAAERERRAERDRERVEAHGFERHRSA